MIKKIDNKTSEVSNEFMRKILFKAIRASEDDVFMLEELNKSNSKDLTKDIIDEKVFRKLCIKLLDQMLPNEIGDIK